MDAYKAYEPAELVNRIQPEELMVLMFTSGTTGRSKGAVSYTHLHKAEPVQDALVLHKESRLLWRCPGQTPLGLPPCG